MEEVWKPCYDNPLYEVSNLARVRSLLYYKSKNIDLDAFNELDNKPTPKIIYQRTDNHGYKKVQLFYRNGKNTQWFVHRLVAYAFVENPNPSIYTEVNHKDGNKSNNLPSNLEWVTHQQNMRHARDTNLYSENGQKNQRWLRGRPVYCTELNKVYPSMMDAAEELNLPKANITAMCRGRLKSVGGYHFRYLDRTGYKSNLYEHQKLAVEKMHNGCVLVGGVGSGKSRTALEYFSRYETDRLRRPKPLYIITTARKRDSLEWESECSYYGISSDEHLSRLLLMIDSWNNLHKYVDVSNSFFIFDEQRVVGYGAWTKAFLKICKSNSWILLSATPGDTWMDYIPVFIANGFYRNKTEFITRHVIFSRFSKYPKVEKYINTDRLEENRDKIIVKMEFEHSIVSHPFLIKCDFNANELMRVYRGRWNVFENEPIQHAGEWCYIMREVVNSDHTRLEKVIDIFDKHRRIIVFYSYDYELEILRDGLTDYGINAAFSKKGLRSFTMSEYNGHRHDPIPDGYDEWIYLVQYNAGSEAWNCITTDTIVFYSLNYSYKIMEQASGRIRRMNSPFNELYYYVLYSESVIDRSILTALKNKKEFQAGRFYRKTFKEEITVNDCGQIVH